MSIIDISINYALLCGYFLLNKKKRIIWFG